MYKRKIIYQKLYKIFSENSIIFIYHYNNLSTKDWSLLKSELSKISEINTIVAQNRIVQKLLDINKNKKTFSKKIVHHDPRSDHLLSSYRIASRWTHLRWRRVYDAESEEQVMLSPSLRDATQPIKTVSWENDVEFFTTENLSKLKTLFQGPTFLIACNSYKKIPLIIKIFQKYPCFIIVGGFFETQPITHIDIQKYLSLNHYNYQYFLMTLIEKPKTILSLKDNLRLPILYILQYKLIYLLDQWSKK